MTINQRNIARYQEGKPVLYPVRGTFYSRAIYNSAAIFIDKKVHLFFRAEAENDECTGRIGLAIERHPKSYTFEINKEPLIWPEFNYECYGCEDPRISKIGSTYLLIYTGHGLRGSQRTVRACLATSNDLHRWRKHGPIFKEKDWYSAVTKPGGIIPEKIDGKYILHFSGRVESCLGESVGFAYSDGDNFLKWKVPQIGNPVFGPRKRFFDSAGVEPGPPAIATKEKIILLYNGWNKQGTHQLGAVLFDRVNPSKPKARTNKPILKPETKWETRGDTRAPCRGFTVPKKIIFAVGYIEREGIGEIFYGASDLYVCVALMKLKGNI